MKLQKDALTEQQVWKERGKEYYDNQQKRQDLIRSKADTTFQEEVDSAVKKWPELFDKDDDKEGNEYMDKSEAFVRAAFHGEGLDPALTEEQRVVAIAKAQAHLALRAKAYSPERLRVNRLRTELDKVKAELAKVKASEPSGGGRQDSGNASRHHRNPEDAIDDIPAIA